MKKQWPPRPEHDFKIGSVQWDIDIEANHRQAGFPEVKYEVIQRRFWQLLNFLAEKGYMIKSVPAALEEVVPSTALMNLDLSEEGYSFVQRHEGKWVDRLYKDKGAEAERKLLEKWHAKFLSERTST
jgi:hypothetical protein